jgi:hypothetical protein
MPSLMTPSQRTATTAKLLLMAGLVVAIEAILRDSIVRTFMAAGLVVFGGGLLLAARQAARH